jgi:hypothetical protein
MAAASNNVQQCGVMKMSHIGRDIYARLRVTRAGRTFPHSTGCALHTPLRAPAQAALLRAALECRRGAYTREPHFCWNITNLHHGAHPLRHCGTGCHRVRGEYAAETPRLP